MKSVAHPLLKQPPRSSPGPSHRVAGSGTTAGRARHPDRPRGPQGGCEEESAVPAEIAPPCTRGRPTPRGTVELGVCTARAATAGCPGPGIVCRAHLPAGTGDRNGSHGLASLDVISFGAFESLLTGESSSGWCRTSCGSCSSEWCRKRLPGLREAAVGGTVTGRRWLRSFAEWTKARAWAEHHRCFAVSSARAASTSPDPPRRSCRPDNPHAWQQGSEDGTFGEASASSGRLSPQARTTVSLCMTFGRLSSCRPIEGS